MAATRIVLAAAGTAGDINPFMALALELRRRGLDPVVASQEEYRARVEAEGVRFHPVRPGVRDVEQELGVGLREIVRRISAGGGGSEFVLRRIAMPFLRRSFEDMRVATEGAAAVVTHTNAFAGRLAAESRGLPWVSATLSPFSFMSAYDPPVLSAEPALGQLRRLTGARFDAALLTLVKLTAGTWLGPVRRLRSELGLPPGPNPLFEGQFSPFATMGLYSSVFGAVQPDFPAGCKLTGFCFYDSEGGGPARLDPELARFLDDGPAPVVFTLGSALVLEPGGFFRRSFQAARELGRRAVFLAGPDGGPGLPADLPQGMLAVRYAPHSLLFPRAAAVVHHGGIGTTAQALRSGAPQLITPFSTDQPDNAARAAGLGVARVMTPGAYHPDRVAGELFELLAAPEPLERAREVRDRLASEDGPAAAADVVEAVLETQARRRAAGLLRGSAAGSVPG